MMKTRYRKQAIRTFGALCVLLSASACVSLAASVPGKLVKTVTWPFDPTPVMVVFHELGDCTIVMGSVSDTVVQGTILYRSLSSVFDQETKTTRYDLPGWPSSTITCQSYPKLSNHSFSVQYINSLEFDGSTDPVNRKAGIIYNPLHPNDELAQATGQVSYGMGTHSWKFGATFLCYVRIKLEDARFITNLGAERRMHVLVGKGTRECAPWGV